MHFPETLALTYNSERALILRLEHALIFTEFFAFSSSFWYLAFLVSLTKTKVKSREQGLQNAVYKESQRQIRMKEQEVGPIIRATNFKKIMCIHLYMYFIQMKNSSGKRINFLLNT